ncbi:MAG: hypothetical protein HUU15_12580 [Candidatus Brocadiae bacterium]|nr:hypothetical protein [Candidatus Brocadiia bacterium]
MTHSQGKAFKWIALGCGGLLLLGGLGIGGCFVLILGATKAPVEAGEKFLTAMADGKEADVKAMADPALAPALLGMLADAPEAWGKSWSITQRHINHSNGVTTATVGAAVTGRDSKTRTITLNLREDGGTWKVVEVSIDGKGLIGGGSSEAPVSGDGMTIDKPEITVSDGGATWKVHMTYVCRGMKHEKKGANFRMALTDGVRLLGPEGPSCSMNRSSKPSTGRGMPRS